MGTHGLHHRLQHTLGDAAEFPAAGYYPSRYAAVAPVQIVVFQLPTLGHRKVVLVKQTANSQ